jgi:ABC-2 type transport system permease protein
MLNLLRFELFKTYAKWRTYIGFLAVGILIPVVMWIMSYSGEQMVQRQLRSLSNDFFISGNLFNGWVIAQLIMNGLWVHVPALIALVAGDQLSGEATAGTFRLILIRPVSRTRILNAKYFSTLIYTASLVLAIAGLSLGLGLWIFGSGDLIAFDREGITVIPESELIGRFILAYALAMWSMFVVASLAFFISSFVENAIGPIITTMTVIVIFLIVSNLPVESVESIKPFLFTTQMSVWTEAFRDPYNWKEILTSCAALGANSLVFYSATLFIFNRKDILS